MIETKLASRFLAGGFLAGGFSAGGFSAGRVATARVWAARVLPASFLVMLACGDAEQPGADALFERGTSGVSGELEAGSESGAASPLQQLSQPIVGGETDSEHLAVVAITLVTRREVALCTGTIIAPNLVLTARHCVSVTDSETVDCSESEFGRIYSPDELWVSSSTTVGDSSFYPVREVLVPDDGSELCGSDIALMIMDGQFRTTSIEPMAPRLNEPARRGEAFTAVGFGDALSDGEAGIRRVLAGLQVVCGPDDCNSPGFLTRREFVGEQGVCDGDSGGPALDEQGRVVGVASRATEDCGLAVYTAITPWRDWILEVGERAFDQGRYDQPEWLAEPGELVASGSTPAGSSPAGSGPAGSSPAGSSPAAVDSAGSSPGAVGAPVQSARREDSGCSIARGVGSELHAPGGTRSAHSPVWAALALAGALALRRRR